MYGQTTLVLLYSPESMKRGTLKWAGLLAAGALALGACTPPKYALYTSKPRDFQANVPYGWSVIADQVGSRYANVAFIGPFDQDFYLGAPSFSVRWHTRHDPHKLRDGSIETYTGPDDYIRQILKSVYGPRYELIQPVHEISAGGRKAKHFVVLSAGPADPNANYGTASDEKGRSINPRKHAYVVIPFRAGFYVLVYPATREGYARYEPQFNQLVNTFKPFKEGPGGADIPVGASAPKTAPGR